MEIYSLPTRSEFASHALLAILAISATQVSRVFSALCTFSLLLLKKRDYYLLIVHLESLSAKLSGSGAFYSGKQEDKS